MRPIARLAGVKASASAMLSERAKALRAAGQDVLDLGLGEPDFDTPAHIIEAAHQAAVAGQTRYPPTVGTLALRQAVQDKFARDNQLDFGLDQIIVSNGAKQVIFAALMATLEQDDEVLLVAPYFDSYRNILALLGAQRRVIQPAQNLRLQPHELEAAITPSTRWLLLNSPSNPAGVTYTRQELQALGEVLARHPHVMILADEIYEHIVFSDFCAFASACPALGERIFTVNGVSKAYAMTGWRIGYGAGPAWLIKAMVTVQSQISSGACSIAQAAAAAALNGPQHGVEDFCRAFQHRRDIVMQAIADTPGLSLVRPDGAFYALINCQAWLSDALPDDTAVATALLERHGVAAVPGSTYETAGHFRISTACADERLRDALSRIRAMAEQLQPR